MAQPTAARLEVADSRNSCTESAESADDCRGGTQLLDVEPSSKPAADLKTEGKEATVFEQDAIVVEIRKCPDSGDIQLKLQNGMLAEGRFEEAISSVRRDIEKKRTVVAGDGQSLQLKFGLPGLEDLIGRTLSRRSGQAVTARLVSS